MATVLYEACGSLARITLNRPDKLNAIDAHMLDEMEDALDLAERNDDVRAIVLAGNGRAFSAGFDLGSPGSGDEDPEDDDPEATRRELKRDFDAIMRFRDCRKPIVAAVHGYCLGSSMEISAVCDLTVAADDSRFGAPEVQYGSGIVCLVLPWIVGQKNARELLLTGDTIDAEKARAMGLINRVVKPERLDEEAETLARRIAGNDALAVRLTREAMNRSMDMAGFRKAIEEALEYDIRIETTATPESVAFRDILQKDGLKAALAWRASR